MADDKLPRVTFRDQPSLVSIADFRNALSFGVAFQRGVSCVSIWPEDDETLGWCVTQMARLKMVCELLIPKYENGDIGSHNYDRKMASVARDLADIARIVWPGYRFNFAVRPPLP